MLCRIEAVGVFVASEDIDGVAADAHAWTRYEAFVDGVANSGIGRARALCSHISFGSKPGHQVVAGGENREYGPTWNGLFDCLQVLGSRMEKQVNMSIDKTGHQRGVSQIDHLYSGSTSDAFPNLGDSLSSNENFARLDDLPRLDIEESGRMQQNRWLRGTLRTSARCEYKKQQATHGAASTSFATAGAIGTRRSPIRL